MVVGIEGICGGDMLGVGKQFGLRGVFAPVSPNAGKRDPG